MSVDGYFQGGLCCIMMKNVPGMGSSGRLPRFKAMSRMAHDVCGTHGGLSEAKS